MVGEWLIIMIVVILASVIVFMIIKNNYENKKQYLLGYEQGSWHTANYNKYTGTYPCLKWRRTYLHSNLQTEDDYRKTFWACGLEYNHTPINKNS